MTIFGEQLDAFELMYPVETMPDDVAPGDIRLLLNPVSLELMFDAREAHFREFNVNKGNWKPYRGLSPQAVSGRESEHPAQSFDSDLRCQHYGRGCSCVGSLVYRAYCHECGHWTGIYDHENKAWEEHLDHCWPGWRDLPVLEGKRVGFGYEFTYPDDYPESFKVTGAPILDCRGDSTMGGKHVAGHSPFGGVKVGVIQDCQIHSQGK